MSPDLSTLQTMTTVGKVVHEVLQVAKLTDKAIIPTKVSRVQILSDISPHGSSLHHLPGQRLCCWVRPVQRLRLHHPRQGQGARQDRRAGV